MITKFGKRFLTDQISGNITNLNKDLAIGIDLLEESENNTRLGFEFYRVPVSFGTSDIQTQDETTSHSVIFKATIPQDVEGQINEIGLYPATRSSINNFDSKFITDFESYIDWTDSDGFKPDYETSNSRIGNTLLMMQSLIGEPNEYTYNIEGLDLSGYSVYDTLKLAYYKQDENLNSIGIKFYSSDTQWFLKTITPESGIGHKMTADIPMSEIFNGATSSAPDKTSINKIGIVINPVESEVSYVGFDGLRINDEDTFDPTFGLITRSLVTTNTGISGLINENTITVDSLNNLFIGQKVSGTGIATDSLITNISNYTVTLSKNNTSAVSGSGTFYGIKKIAGRPLDIEYRIDMGWGI
jgi:hypothetical protein